jgi:hypothetical protein
MAKLSAADAKMARRAAFKEAAERQRKKLEWQVFVANVSTIARVVIAEDKQRAANTKRGKPAGRPSTAPWPDIYRNVLARLAVRATNARSRPRLVDLIDKELRRQNKPLGRRIVQQHATILVNLLDSVAGNLKQ